MDLHEELNGNRIHQLGNIITSNMRVHKAFGDLVQALPVRFKTFIGGVWPMD